MGSSVLAAFRPDILPIRCRRSRTGGSSARTVLYTIGVVLPSRYQVSETASWDVRFSKGAGGSVQCIWIQCTNGTQERKLCSHLFYFSATKAAVHDAPKYDMKFNNLSYAGRCSLLVRT